MEREAALARRETAAAALAAIASAPATEARSGLEGEYRARAAFNRPEPPVVSTEAVPLQRRAVDAQRDRLERLRRDGTIGDNAYHAIEEALDLIEITADPRVRMEA